MAYSKINWTEATPITAENLNKMEEGIANHDHYSLGNSTQKFVVVVDESYNFRPNLHRGVNLGTSSCGFKELYLQNIFGHTGADLAFYPGDAQWGGAKIMASGYFVPTQDKVLVLGSQNYRYHSLYLMNAPIISSDAQDKLNIKYLNDDVSTLSSEENITNVDLYNFIKNDLKIATFDYKTSRNIDTANIGFIAQDVVGTNVGSRIVSVSEDGKHSYNLGTYVSTLAGALQVAINKIDELEKMIKTEF